MQPSGNWENLWRGNFKFFYLAVSEISYIKWLKFPFFNILILIFLADK